MADTISYKKAAEYWAAVPATVDGVLGGFGFISNLDIEGSKSFLSQLLSMEKAPQTLQALDCGAGIGRITKLLLLPVFQKVDIVEQDPKFIEAAKDYLQEQNHTTGTFYTVGLQDFEPDKKYNVIWCQWVLGHLNDDDFVAFFMRCRKALTENGLIVVKENVTSSGRLERDDTDSSVTRPLKVLLKLFKKAKLKHIKECKQINFPKGLYPVHMFALAPEKLNEEPCKIKEESGRLLDGIQEMNIKNEVTKEQVGPRIKNVNKC